MSEATLDITHEVCPMTYVRVKLALERQEAGALLHVRLLGEASARNVPRSALEDGHEVVLLEPLPHDVWRLVLRKSRRT